MALYSRATLSSRLSQEQFQSKSDPSNNEYSKDALGPRAGYV